MLTAKNIDKIELIYLTEGENNLLLKLIMKSLGIIQS